MSKHNIWILIAVAAVGLSAAGLSWGGPSDEESDAPKGDRKAAAVKCEFCQVQQRIKKRRGQGHHEEAERVEREAHRHQARRKDRDEAGSHDRQRHVRRLREAIQKLRKDGRHEGAERLEREARQHHERRRAHDEAAPEDRQRRARHLMEAARNLRAAGANEMAKEIARKAEAMQHSAPRRDDLEKRVHELAQAVRRLHGQMEQMRKRIEQLSKNDEHDEHREHREHDHDEG